jgi:hypothetical protein
MAQKCVGCGLVWISRARAQQAVAYLVNAGWEATEARATAPRCWRCTDILLMPSGDAAPAKKGNGQMNFNADRRS